MQICIIIVSRKVILMIEKLKEFFNGELEIEDIRSFQILNPQKGKLVGLW